MKKYALLYRADPSVESQPEEMKDWGEWIDKLQKDNTLVDIGNLLQQEGKVVLANGNVKDNPIEAPEKEVIIAYDVIQCSNIEEAIQIIQGGPAAKYNCSVEIRELVDMESI